MFNNKNSFFVAQRAKTEEIIKNELSREDLDALKSVLTEPKLRDTIARTLSINNI